ncbi:hypothetical protein, partial [Acinetobacter schindleri]|uniref:hypothetical protein n=1 Tax=Acinetobacter schindleri TaxID=108981 RepID=UPI0030FCBFB5
INSSSELPPLVGGKAPGTRIKLQVFREGRTRDYDVTLTALDSGSTASSSNARPQADAPAGATNPLGLVGRDLDAAQRRQFGLAADEGVL